MLQELQLPSNIFWLPYWNLQKPWKTLQKETVASKESSGAKTLTPEKRISVRFYTPLQ